MINPIGIFDSGIGGLTVVKELRKLLPDEHLVYFGDTARIPYGTKSKRLIEQYALEDSAFLMQYDIKLLVVACNTASSLAMEVLQNRLAVPVIGVVQPGAGAAVRMTKNRKIGVIGTTATVGSNAYRDAIVKMAPAVEVFGQPCPLLVPLVEEGWLNEYVTILTLKKYLHDLLKQQIDTLILGCTHYPLLEPAIGQVTGGRIALIDSGRETARVVKEELVKRGLLNGQGRRQDDQFYVSDIPAKFEEIGSRFLGQPFKQVKRVDFEQFLVNMGSSSQATIQRGVE